MANESLITHLLYQSIESERHTSLFDKIENDVHALVSNISFTNIKETLDCLQKIERILTIHLPKSEQVVKLKSLINKYIGDIKRDTGILNGNEGAIKYYILSLYFAKMVGDKVLLAKGFLSLGACYEMQNNFLIAERLYRKSCDICTTLKYQEFLHSNSLTRIGCILTKMGEMDNARGTLHEAKEIRQNDLIFNDDSFILQKLSIIDFKSGKFDKAFYATEKMIHQNKAKSSLFNVQTLILLTDISLKSGEINTGMSYATLAEQLALKGSLNHQLSCLYSLVDQSTN